MDVRTRDLVNAFIRQLEMRGIDPVAYLRAAGVSGAELEQRFRDEAANSIGRELVLEGVADRLGIEVSDDDIRADLLEDGESEEPAEAGGADCATTPPEESRRSDRREVPDLAGIATTRASDAGQEEGGAAEKKLYIG